MTSNNTSEPQIDAIMGDQWWDPKDLYLPYLYYFITPYFIITLAALIGNSLTIATIVYIKKLHSPTYLLLCSLAVSDLFFTLLGPFLVHWMFVPGHWFLGAIGCKLVFFFMRFQYAYSVLLLVTAAGYRFLAIRYPILYRRRKPQTVKIIGIIFITSLSACAPLLYALDTVRTGPYVDCRFIHWTENQKHVYHTVMQIMLYVVPLCSMIFLYTATCLKLRQRMPGFRSNNQMYAESRRRRMAYLLMALVACFFVSWTPFSCVEFLYLIHFPVNIIYYTKAYLFGMLLVFTSAAINPIIYCFLCNEFRHGLKFLIRKTNKRFGCYSRTSRKYNLRSYTDEMVVVEAMITSV